MGSDWLLDARGLLALAALMSLPGLTVVPATWTSVPFLSLGFWLSSWWWQAAFGGSRSALLWSALAGFATLASLRFLKPLELRRPGWPAACTAALALAQLVPLASTPLPLGQDGPLRALTARLLVAHDGLPRTYEPLAPVQVFGAATSGTDLLAGDISLLSGLPAHRSALLAGLVARGLLALALYALLQRGTRASTAAAFTLVATAAVDVLSPAPGPGCPLSLALVLAAAGLLARGSNRAPAVAAGTFLGAAVASDPLTCAGALALLGAGAVARLRSTPAADRPAVRTRLALATGVALVWAAPFLWQLDFTWSDSERMLLPPLVAIARRALAPALCAGFVIAAWRTPFAVGVANHVAPAAGLLALLGLLAGPLRARPAAEPAPADRSLQAWTAEHTLPLDCVAVDPGSAGVWIPALADRATDRPPLPAYYQDELAAGRRARRCRWRYPEGLAGERRAGAALPQLLEER